MFLRRSLPETTLIQPSEWNAPKGRDRHEICCEYYLHVHPSRGLTKPRQPYLQLRTLATCCQFTVEALEVAYKAFGLSFDTCWEFHDFLESAPGARNVRRLCLHICMYTPSLMRQWDENLRMVSERMKDLRDIRLEVSQLLNKDQKYAGPDSDTWIHKAFVCLAQLPLQAATVIIRDNDDANYHHQYKDTNRKRDEKEWRALSRWTEAEKQECSQYISNLLLRKDQNSLGA